MTKDLKKHFFNGVVWSGTRRFAEQGIQTVTTLILARLLSPNEFGVIGIANIFILFANTINRLGIVSAIIQRKEIDEGHLSSAFWANMVTGVTLCLVMMAISSPAAKFFHNEDVQPVLFALSFIFIIGALNVVQTAQFSKNLQFGKLAGLGIWEMSVNAVISIGLAVTGLGVWSLVWGRLGGVLAGVVVAWHGSSWRPKWLFVPAKFRELFKFGIYTLSTNILTYLGQNLDYILVGRFLGVGPLGIYTMAYNLVTLPRRKMSTIIASVAFPVFSKIQDDTARVSRNYLKMLRYISFVTFPLLTGLMVLAPLFVRVILGAKWEAAIVPIQIMCVLGMYGSISTTVGSIFCAKGRPDLELKTDVVQLAALAGFLLVGVRYGINGVAAAVTLMSITSKPFIFYIIARLLRVRLVEIYRATFWAFIASIVMAVIILGMDYTLQTAFHVPMTIRFILLIPAGALIYWRLQKILKINTLAEVYEIFMSNLKPNGKLKAAS